MATQDLKNEIDTVTTLVPDTRTASTNGSSVDLAGYNAASIDAIVGTITDGTHSLTVEESDDGSTWAAVDAAFLQGSFSDLASNTNQQAGYVNNKRYLRVNCSVSGATNGGKYAVVVVRGYPTDAPV
jgi:hypothetical protein